VTLPPVEGLAERLRWAGWDCDLGDPEAFQALDRGFGSDVYGIPGAVVLRLARTASSHAGHAREQVLLPLLDGALPARVPAPVWSAPAGPDFPHGALALTWLAGATPAGPEPAPDPSDIGGFMAELHRVEPGALAVAGLPGPDAIDARRRADAGLALRVAEDRWAPARVDALATWLDRTLAVARSDQFEPVLRHGDLWWANLRVQDGRLSGVVDWENAGVGDPAEDLATQMYFGAKPYSEILAAYLAERPDDPGLERRACALFALRELMGIRLCLEADDMVELESELDALWGTVLSA